MCWSYKAISNEEFTMQLSYIFCNCRVSNVSNTHYILFYPWRILIRIAEFQECKISLSYEFNPVNKAYHLNFAGINRILVSYYKIYTLQHTKILRSLQRTSGNNSILNNVQLLQFNIISICLKVFQYKDSTYLGLEYQ